MRQSNIPYLQIVKSRKSHVIYERSQVTRGYTSQEKRTKTNMVEYFGVGYILYGISKILL